MPRSAPPHAASARPARRRAGLRAVYRLALAAWVAAACARAPQPAGDTAGGDTATPAASADAAGGDSLTARRWTLVELDARAVVATPDGQAPYLLLRADTARVEGYGGCNSLFGRYERGAGGRLRFEALGGTLRACVDPAPAEQERRFTSALQATRRYAIRGDTLTLFDDAAVRARLVAPPR